MSPWLQGDCQAQGIFCLHSAQTPSPTWQKMLGGKKGDDGSKHSLELFSSAAHGSPWKYSGDNLTLFLDNFHSHYGLGQPMMVLLLLPEIVWASGPQDPAMIRQNFLVRMEDHTDQLARNGSNIITVVFIIILITLDKKRQRYQDLGFPFKSPI